MPAASRVRDVVGDEANLPRRALSLARPLYSAHLHSWRAGASVQRVPLPQGDFVELVVSAC